MMAAYRRRRRPSLALRLGRSLVIVGAIAIVIVALFLAVSADASGPACEYGSGPCGPTVPPPTTTTSVPETTTTTEDGGLPFTGGDVRGLLLVGGALLIAGVAIVGVRRAS